MGQRTRKEFAEYVKMDVKSLADKIRYQEKKLGKSFGQDFTDTKIYSEQEQIEICELLEIPVFRTAIHGELTKDVLSEKQREQLKKQMHQLSELFELVDNANFVKVDENIWENLLANVGSDFRSWFNQRKKYDFQSPTFDNVVQYLAERD